MNFSRVIQQLLHFYRIFIAPPKQWISPGKCDVLLYDASGEEVVRPYLSDYRVEVLAVRGELVIFPCFLRALFTKSFWLGKPLSAYADAVIAATSPKVIISFIDNNFAFYQLSARWSSIKTMFLQNGWRGEVADVFESIVRHDDYRVDYMVVFNRLIGQKYRQFVSGEVVAAGSLKNNHVEKPDDIQHETVVFVSQYRDRPVNGPFMFCNADGDPVLWDNFYETDALVVRLLGKWCELNGKRLSVCGMQGAEQRSERDWFAGLLNGYEWEYVSRSSIYGSYRIMASAELVVAVDSTLGYEAFGRGKKIALFTARGICIGSSAANFGWPGEFPDNGPFWTNHASEAEFNRIMDYLNTVSEKEWSAVHAKYADDLMAYNPGNSRFKALLKELLQETGQ